MVATLKKNIDGNCYCSNCRMGQPKPEETCFFCGAVFSNYEDIQFQYYLETIEQENFEEGDFLKHDKRFG